MPEKGNRLSSAGIFDDRKRARERTSVDWLKGASPKKGKKDATAFSFPTFETELDEIEQRCQKGSCDEENPALDAQQQQCSAVGLWKGLQRELLHSRQTPEPPVRKPLQPCNHGITPPMTQSLPIANGPVQTLNARSMPLSPFEYGALPTDEGVEVPRLVSSTSCAQLPAENAVISDEGSAPSPGGFSEDAAENDPVDTSNGTSFRCASDLEGSMAMMTDIPLSQTVSQESSLAETKVLKPPGVRNSSDLSDSLSQGFLFSRSFSFLGLLGDTKTCSVYHARGPDGNYAIKEIKRPFVSSADRADMLKEYTAVNSLPEHPNVVHYLMFWQESRKLHIQMELCEGGSLDSLLKRNILSQEEDMQISESLLWILIRFHKVHVACSDSAAGLKHIHDNNVIHMDIKPENIFLKDTGMFKVGDFGIAVRVPVSGGWEEGDGRYVAPELLCRSHAPTPGADVYSLGATILHSATGSISKEDRAPACAAQKLASAGFSEPLQELVAAMLAPQVQQRPTTETICSFAQEQLDEYVCEVSRRTLQDAAQALQEQRLSLLQVRGSASFNQSLDQGTPGERARRNGSNKDVEKSWGAHFLRQSQQPGSTGRDTSLRIPPLPTGSRANILADRGRAALLDRIPGQQQGVGTPPSVAPQQRALNRQRSPSVGSLRCGALSYSSNGQASGSLNLEVTNELSIGAEGPLERHESLMGTDTHRSLPHPDRRKLFRSSTAGRSHLLGRPSSLRPDDRNQHPLRFPPANSRDSQPDREGGDMAKSCSGFPKDSMLNRYFSSQMADKFIPASDNDPPKSAGEIDCPQLEVTGPSEEERVQGVRRRSNPVQPPPTLSNLYERVARTKGREMVQKGLQDVAVAEASSVSTALEDSASGAVSSERHERTSAAGVDGGHTGKASTRRTRGLKIASMAAGGKENSGPVANCSSGCKEQSSPKQGRTLSLASVKGCSRSSRMNSGVLRPHRLNFASALACSKQKDATGMHSSGRPELSVPPSFGRVLQMPRQ